MNSLVIESADSQRGWVDLINDRFVPLQISNASSVELSGKVSTTHIGHLQASAVCSGPQVFKRPASLVGVGRELIAIGVVEAGCGYLEQNGHRCQVDGGSFAWYDTSRPFTWAFSGDYELRVYAWPRRSLGVSDTELERLTAHAVSAKTGVGRLVAPSLKAVFGDDDVAVSPHDAGRVADELAEFGFIAAAAAYTHWSCDDIDHDLLGRIQGFIEENFDDPELSSRLIADHFYMSTRTLNRVFAKAGLSVAAWVKERRMQHALRMLKSSAGRSLSIATIAYNCGFSTPAAFSRDFARRFGQSPSQYRLRQC